MTDEELDLIDKFVYLVLGDDDPEDDMVSLEDWGYEGYDTCVLDAEWP